MKRFLLIVFVLLVVGLLVAGGYYVYRHTDWVHIRTIRYNESAFIDIDSIELYSGIALGTPFFEVDLRKAEAGLMTHPYILSAQATARFPHEVEFEIVYRSHLLCIRYLDILLSIDEDLVVLESLQEPLPGYIVEGLAFQAFAAGQRLQVERNYLLRNVVSYVKLLGVAQMQADTAIDCTDGHIRFRIDGITVDFGTGENPEERFNTFYAVLQDLRRKGATGGTIDLSGDGTAIYRPFED